MTETHQEVMDALSEVIDPCSCQTEIPIDIVELGLISEVELKDGNAVITLLPTSPMCMYVPHMAREIKDRVSRIDGITDVGVRQATKQVWTRDRMSEPAMEARREHVENRIEDQDLTPYYASY